MNILHFRTGRVPLEALIWGVGLLIIVLLDPAREHQTFCLFRLCGIPWCPGCGLGRSIGFLFRGEWSASWAAHPLGAPAVMILLLRVFSLVRRTRRALPFSHYFL